jgi:hypothetical protein
MNPVRNTPKRQRQREEIIFFTVRKRQRWYRTGFFVPRIQSTDLPPTASILVLLDSDLCRKGGACKRKERHFAQSPPNPSHIYPSPRRL